jgi:integrase
MTMTKRKPSEHGTGIYKRGKVFWVQYCREGKPFRESVKGAVLGDRTIATGLKVGEAKRLLNLRKGNVEREAPVGPRVGRLTFEQAMDDVRNDYRAHKRRSFADMDRRIRLHLAPFFQGKRMVAITTRDARAYIAHRQAEGAANATINHELHVLSAAFTLALEDETLHARPRIPTLEENNARAGFFERDQFEAVRRHLPAPLRALVSFMFITGWRNRSETYRLLWAWVDWTGGEIRLPPGVAKNKESRTFPMTQELRQLLTAQRATVDAIQRERGRIIPTVFCWEDGRPVKDMRGAWLAACANAGCPGRLMHDFRRTSIRNMVRAGISEKVAMDMAGHKTRAVFDRYDISSKADQQDAARRLDAVSTIPDTIGPSRDLQADGDSPK